MTTQSSLSEKRGTTRQIGWTTRTVHQHRAQIALGTSVPGIGRDSVKPSRENIVARNGCVAGLKAAGELKKSFGFGARRGKLRDRRNYASGRLRSA
jgi:hypothetical protein